MKRELVTDEPRNALQWYKGPDGGVAIIAKHAHDIFDFRKRPRKHSPFTVAMCIPTGIGAKPGGDAGDAGPIAAAMPCDRIIVHPNVVNGSDLIALPSHGLYVEGYTFSRLLMGTIALRPVRQNRIVLYYEGSGEAGILVRHAASAANHTCGYDVTARVCNSLHLIGGRNPSCPEHHFDVNGFDAIAIASRVEIVEHEIKSYYNGNDLNPWGVAEAMLSHFVTAEKGIPCAHAPMDCQDPFPPIGAMSAEAISRVWLHSVLHGLNRAPAIVEEGIDAGDIDVLCLPLGCYGLQVRGAIAQGIPIIYIDDNNKMNNDPANGYVVRNWTECLGMVSMMRAGIKRYAP